MAGKAITMSELEVEARIFFVLAGGKEAAFAALLDHGERRVKRILAGLPEGEWSAEDWLDGDGEFRGGLILPGVDLMRSSLARKAGACDGSAPY